jgi:hypothetical protein
VTTVSTPEDLERQIDGLRVAIRRALTTGDRRRAAELRIQLRAAEQAWDDAITQLERASAAAGERREPPETAGPAGPGRSAAAGARREPPEAAGAAGPGRLAAAGGALLPIREQVHQALTLLGVCAAPRLIVAVHDAFASGPLVAARLTSLRRDEERSFRSAPHARAYYLCAALTADLLAPARGLLAVSTWPLERRVIGPLSPRVDYLTAAIAVADSITRIPDPGTEAMTLLRRFAVNIPGALPSRGGAGPAPSRVAEAARAELEVHAARDEAHRRAAAQRAAEQLDDAGQLFGSRQRSAGSGSPAGKATGS